MSANIEKRQAVAATYQGPKSICTCGHAGDGTGKGSVGMTSLHAGIIGHGACTVSGCPCGKFTWKAFLPSFEAALAGI
jgi:hypothetical protein